MDQAQAPTGLAKAGGILLLVGAILQAVGALVLLLYGLFFRVVIHAMEMRRSTTATVPPGFVTGLSILFLVLAALAVVGCIFAFLAHGRARSGDLNGAFTFGLVAALLPPVQLLNLLGAIFCKAGQHPPALPPSPPGWQPAPPPPRP